MKRCSLFMTPWIGRARLALLRALARIPKPKLFVAWSLGDDGRLNNDDDSDLSNFLTSDALDPRSALKAYFDRSCVACEQICVATPATIADVVNVAKAKLRLQQ